MPIIEGILSGLGNLAGSYITSQANIKMQREANQANRQLAEYSYQKDLEQWQRANDYNSPVAQMARLKSAGLNPNLAYGSGNVVGNSSTPIARYQAPKMEAARVNYDLGIAQGIQAYQNAKLNAAQVDNVREQTKNVTAEIALKTLEKASKEIGNSRSQFELDQMKTLKQNSIDVARQTLENLKLEGQLKDWQKKMWEQGINPNDPWYYRDLKKLGNSSFMEPLTPDQMVDRKGRKIKFYKNEK